MKTILLNISDIHIGSETPENEVLVLNSFLKDVEEQIRKLRYDKIYVLIGGDLVFASSKAKYDDFEKNIIQKLIKILSIDKTHFIIIPGNHDLNRSFIKDIEESFMPIFNSRYDEKKFNDLMRKEAQKTMFYGKFHDFQNFMDENMNVSDYSMSCNYYELNKTWSIHTLNTAILSCGGYNDIDDNGHMGVDTRALQENLSKDTHPRKILLMHHPEYFCMDWVKHELRKLYHSSFDLVLSGHTHDQDLFCNKNKKFDYIRCEAPQLYTDKYDDVLGYNFIELEDDHVSRIIYREWFEKRNKFRSGSAFTEDESGIETFDVESNEPIDTDDVATIWRTRLRQAMEAFVGQPYIWIERYLSDDRIDQVFKMTKSTLFSESDIINNSENIRIVAPSQYGLTCYGIHFLQTLWSTKREFGIMINADGVHTRKFENLVNPQIRNL